MYYKGDHSLTFIDDITKLTPDFDVNDPTFRRVNTWKDFNMIPTSRPVFNTPELKTNYIEVPGRTGEIDLTSRLSGHPHYKNRTGTWEFLIPPTLSQWPTDYQRLVNRIHGFPKYIISDDDPYHYYYGRLTVDDWKNGNDGKGNTVTIGYNLEPYKIALYYYGDEQMWDPFNFYTDKFIDRTEGTTWNGVQCPANISTLISADFLSALNPTYTTQSAIGPCPFYLILEYDDSSQVDPNLKTQVAYNNKVYYFDASLRQLKDDHFVYTPNRDTSHETYVYPHHNSGKFFFDISIKPKYDCIVYTIMEVRSL